MLLYLDTSAFVPLLLDERSTPICSRLWRDADVLVSSVVLHTEAAAACGQAHRLGRITTRQLSRCLQLNDQLSDQLSLVSVDHRLAQRAGVLAVDLALRGYDAIHAATAEALASAGTACATSDAALVRAWHAMGIATIDTTTAP